MKRQPKGKPRRGAIPMPARGKPGSRPGQAAPPKAKLRMTGPAGFGK